MNSRDGGMAALLHGRGRYYFDPTDILVGCIVLYMYDFADNCNILDNYKPLPILSWQKLLKEPLLSFRASGS